MSASSFVSSQFYGFSTTFVSDRKHISYAASSMTITKLLLSRVSESES